MLDDNTLAAVHKRYLGAKEKTARRVGGLIYIEAKQNKKWK